MSANGAGAVGTDGAGAAGVDSAEAAVDGGGGGCSGGADAAKALGAALNSVVDEAGLVFAPVETAAVVAVAAVGVVAVGVPPAADEGPRRRRPPRTSRGYPWGWRVRRRRPAGAWPRPPPMQRPVLKRAERRHKGSGGE